MYTKKFKRGITLVELLAGLVLMGLLTTFVTSITFYVSRGSKIVSDNAFTTHRSSTISLIILNTLTEMSVTDCSTKTVNGYEEVTFTSNKQNYIYKNAAGEEQVGTLYLDTISESEKALWKGPTSVTFSVDADNNALKLTRIDIYGNKTESLSQFDNSTVIKESSYVTTKNSEADNSWFFEVKIDYKQKSMDHPVTYYTSIYVTDTDKNN